MRPERGTQALQKYSLVDWAMPACLKESVEDETVVDIGMGEDLEGQEPCQPPIKARGKLEKAAGGPRDELAEGKFNCSRGGQKTGQWGPNPAIATH